MTKTDFEIKLNLDPEKIRVIKESFKNIVMVFPEPFEPRIIMVPHSAIDALSAARVGVHLQMEDLHRKMNDIGVVCNNDMQESITKLRNSQPGFNILETLPTLPIFNREDFDIKSNCEIVNYKSTHPDKHRFGTEKKKNRGSNNRKKTKYRRKK